MVNSALHFVLVLQFDGLTLACEQEFLCAQRDTDTQSSSKQAVELWPCCGLAAYLQQMTDTDSTGNIWFKEV